MAPQKHDRKPARSKHPVEPPGDDGLMSVASRTGTIAVTCTTAGLPVKMTLAAAAMRRRPDALAAEILALCRLAGTAAGVHTRTRLSDDGVGDDALELLGLPSRADLVTAESVADAWGSRGRA